MLWLTLLVPLTVFTAMYENFGLKKGYRLSIWFFFVVANALAIAFSVHAGDLSTLLLTFVGGGVLALILDKVGCAVIGFGQAIFPGLDKTPREEEEAPLNDEHKGRLDAAFTTPNERAEQAERKAAAARSSNLRLMNVLFTAHVRPEFKAVEKYLSGRDVPCSVRQVAFDEPTGQSPSITFCWGHIEQDWGRYIDHELRFEVDTQGDSMVVRFAIVGGESGVIENPVRFTKEWVADTLISLVTKSLPVKAQALASGPIEA